MSAEENKAIVRRWFEGGWTDSDVLDEIFTADTVWHPGPNSGLENLKQVMAGWPTGFPDGRFDVQEIVAEGDTVVARWKFSGTHTGEWFGIPPTNKQVRFGGTTIYHMAGNKIAEQWGHFDVFTFYVELGLIPPWEEFVKQAQSKLT